jgi:hypothetical protein
MDGAKLSYFCGGCCEDVEFYKILRRGGVKQFDFHKNTTVQTKYIFHILYYSHLNQQNSIT